MNVLLIYPRYPDTFWSFKHVMKFVSKKATFPPLGLMTVASLLPKSWKLMLVDMNVEKLSEHDIKWADMVFVSAMLVQKDSAKRVIEICNSHKKKVVVGGPAFTTGEKYKGVSHYILNEAEITLPMFIRDLKKGRAKKIYTSMKRPNIHSTPKPLWSLIEKKNYASMVLQYSRGCPFDCEFCDIIIMNGRTPRTKSPLQFISELQSLYRSGWRGSVFIVDDNFIGNKSDVKNLLREIIIWQNQNKFPFKFFTEASLNLAQDPELLTLMSKANFYKVFLGFESPDIECLKECSKYQNTSLDLRKAVQIIHNHGMQVMGGFILGFDNDNETIFDRQIRFIQQIGVVTAMVGMLNALPKTRLWKRLEDEGRLIRDATGENTDGSINFIPKMGIESLQKGYKHVISNIYSPKLYYKRVNKFLKSYKPTVKTRISATELKAFFHSMWSIGILSKSRFRYWWLIGKTSLLKAKAVPIAVELSIFGEYFENFSKTIKPKRFTA